VPFIYYAIHEEADAI